MSSQGDEIRGYDYDSSKHDAYTGGDSFDYGNGDGTNDPVMGLTDYGTDYVEDDVLKKGYVKFVQGDYFEGHVNPSDQRTIRNDDYSRKEFFKHEETQTLLGNLGINKA